VTGMKAYYISRAAISVAVGGVLLLEGSPWWLGLGAGGLVMIWFSVAPRLGRYAVRPGHGMAALRRDERGEAINDAAARNAFVVCMLVIAAVVIYTRAAGAEGIANLVLESILLLGVAVYYASDFWLRRLQ
jgi:hypothetical protein